MGDDHYPRCSQRCSTAMGDGRRERCAKRAGHVGPHLYPRSGGILPEPMIVPGTGVALVLALAVAAGVLALVMLLGAVAR